MTPSQAAACGMLAMSGLLGSLGHCLGMCGPLAVMMSLQVKATGGRAWRYALLYHGARVGVYASMGAVAASAVSLLSFSERLSRLAGALSLALGVAVILLALGYLDRRPGKPSPGRRPWLSAAMAWAIHRGGPWGAGLLGALNGLLPCGLVYSALLVAASTGSPLRGAVGMALFGASTAPALVAAGLGAARAGARTRLALARMAGLLMAAVGLQLALRGLAELHLVPHLQAGRLMLW